MVMVRRSCAFWLIACFSIATARAATFAVSVSPDHAREPLNGRILLLLSVDASKEPRQQICATNVAFGDADGKSLYITACTTLYRIRTNIPGSRLRATR